MATVADPDFRARLQALSDKFALTVPGTLEKIAAAQAACDAHCVPGGLPATEALHGLHEVLHGVAGSAGTFGFAVLGQECRRIEQQVRAVMSGADGDWAAISGQISQLLRWAECDPRASCGTVV